MPDLDRATSSGLLEVLKRPLRGSVVQKLWRAAQARLKPEDQNARYDRETIEVMRRVLRAGSLCVDVGAHSGALLEPMFALAPAARHFAFEPLPHLAAELRERFPTARVVEAALSDHDGTSSFMYVENDPGYSGLQRRVYDRPDPIIRELTVTLARLDDVVPANERVDFIKIDVEGGEYHVLRGALETIRRGRSVIVFEAGAKSTGQYGVAAADVFGLVTDVLGYELSTMQRWLKRSAPFAPGEFHWGLSDFYFIASPAETRSRSK